MALLLSGCATAPATKQMEAEARITQLREEITELGPGVAEQEASKVAEVAVLESLRLSREYRAVRPPWWHNVLVNYGFRNRGLCFEWTNDLFVQLLQIAPRSIDLQLAVARMDTAREHNAIVVTAHDQSFENGLVLDAWRGSGRIWFGPVEGDKYPWVPLPADRIDPEIAKLLTADSVVGGIEQANAKEAVIGAGVRNR